MSWQGALLRFRSPLRYPGGKVKITNFVKLLFLKNGFVGKDYVEPYAGGSNVALNLLFEEYVSHIHINDINRGVYSFWQAVLNNTEQLCRRISKCPLDMKEWRRQKKVQEEANPTPLDLAFSTFYLNRTNRSGIITGGVIGGNNQRGSWKMDARFNRNELIRRIEKIGRFSSRITLTQEDGAFYLRRKLNGLPKDAFLFLDPPYYAKSRLLYEHNYKHDDHVEVAGLIKRSNRPWIVSYDATPQILKIYRGCTRLHYDLNYSAASPFRGREVMFFSPGLKRPSVKTPAKISKRIVDEYLVSSGCGR